MAIHNYQAGIGSVGSYQVSGVPWVTGSGLNGIATNTEDKISFPSVAKSVMVMLHDAANENLHVHFNSSGSNGNVYDGKHYFVLSNNRDSVTFNVKCKEVWISNPPASNGGSGNASGYIVVAELTGIDKKEMFDLTGSGLTTIDGS